jgi:streptogramin lyase
VQDRLARDRQGRLSDEEIAALKQKADAHDALEAQNLSDLEKAQAERDAAIAERDAAKATASSTARKSAIVAAAAAAGADAEIVHALLATSDFKVTQGDNTFEVTVDDSGTVTGATDAVKALVELKNIAGNPTPPGPGDGGPRAPLPAQTIQEQIAAAEASGDTATAMSLKSQKLAELVTGA